MTAQLLRPPARWRWSWSATQITLMACCVGLAGSITGLNLGLANLLERQLQTFFFDVRGPVRPSGIVVLAIDDESLNSAEPGTEAWPWPRATYAKVIDRVMAAGASGVGVDIILETPSVYGEADDQQLANTLQRHGDRVVLAAQFYNQDTLTGAVTAQPQVAGTLMGLHTPLAQFQQAVRLGLINMPQAADGRIHSLGSAFVRSQQAELDATTTMMALETEQTDLLPFADAVLQAAQIDYPPPRGFDIFFHGPPHTIPHVPIWQVLNDSAWERNLGNGQIFENQIVLIGGTAPTFQDEHLTPFGRYVPEQQLLAGVEVQANAIATLATGRTIGVVWPSSAWEGVYVLVILGGVSGLMYRCQRPLYQIGCAGVAILLIGGLGYGLFTLAYRRIPVAVPSVGIVAIGLTQITSSAMREQIRRQQLRRTLKQYAALPIVQEIISQQDDLRDLLLEREAEIFGKVLGRRYRVVKVLGAGGFSETYIAEDIQRPSHPPCVVKRLRLMSDKPQMLKLMRRLFLLEAETLERLGQHPQIPQLLAYFEEDQEFYLVQELIVGRSLHSEIALRGILPTAAVIRLLVDLLTVLKFVHRQNVIHRDIKPVNIIRRTADGKPVLIDFGIAKKIENQLTQLDENVQFTIGLGTRGYMPQEQAAGMPNFTSDLYALGMTAIEGLTGLAPSQLPKNQDGLPAWATLAPQISAEMRSLLERMTHYDHKQRYQSVDVVLQALKQLPEVADFNIKFDAPLDASLAPSEPIAAPPPSDDDDPDSSGINTQHWSEADAESAASTSAILGATAAIDDMDDFNANTQPWLPDAAASDPAAGDRGENEIGRDTQIWHPATPEQTDPPVDGAIAPHGTESVTPPSATHRLDNNNPPEAEATPSQGSPGPPDSATIETSDLETTQQWEGHQP